MKRLVLTGGPCAGKTTGLNFIKQKLSDFGYAVIIVPEAATHIISSGLMPTILSKKQYFSFQELIADTQDTFEKIGERALLVLESDPEKHILLCDRGKMDVRAYMSDKDFNLLLEIKRGHIVDWRERYDGIFHLVTVADGKEELYTLENNSARHEKTPEEARLADKRTQHAWLGHPHLRVIDNSTLFEGKMKRLLQEIQRLLGIPVVLEIERKFLVQTPVQFDKLPVPYERVLIEQAYLNPQTEGHGRIRRRSQRGGATYYRTFKIPSSNLSVREEREEQITALEYYELMEGHDQDLDVIKKERNCFIWHNQYFELDVFVEPAYLKGLTLLELELTEENSLVDIPDWLGSIKDVTENPGFQNYNLAKRPES